MPSESTIQDIRTAIGDIDAEFRRMDERRAELHRQRRALVGALEFFGGSADDAPDQTTTPAERPVPSSDVPNAIHGILAEFGALHRQEIHDRLAGMGAQVGGQSPVAVVSSYLSRDPRFESVGGGRWALAEQSEGGGDDGGGKSKGGDLHDAIFAVLSAERPLHRRAIYDRVRDMGVTVRGENPVNNVSAHMSLDPRFQSVGGGLWDLTQPPTAETGNHQNDSQDEEEGEEDVPW